MVIPAPGFDPALTLQAVQDERCTSLYGVPTMFIAELIKEGAYYGMQTFDQHLVALIRDGVITLEAAMAASTSPHDLTVELRRLGLVA